MKAVIDSLSRIHKFIHHHLLAMLLGMYLLAILAPGFGLQLRALHLPFGSKQSILSFMLGILLFNAGLGVRTSEFKNFGSRLSSLASGLIANSVLPLLYLSLCSIIFASWNTSVRFETLLVSLALIGSMPIAGASATWSQEAGGNLALSLGLVLFSTILSPVLSPLSFHLASFATVGRFTEILEQLSRSQTSSFLVTSVVAPTIAGIAVRTILPNRIREMIQPLIKIVSVITLMLLNYSNAAVALPEAIHRPDYYYLAAALAITSVLCITSFSTGLCIAKLLKADKNDRASLVFGLGMNNNGTGLVFASLFLSSLPGVMLPIVLYNLEQQIIAGLFQYLLERRTTKIDVSNSDSKIYGLQTT